MSVIPNAIVAAEFTPDPPAESERGIHISKEVKIIVASRLVYRKGVDILVAVIPLVCEMYPHVDFLIAGDGAKRIELEQMCEKYMLEHRVKLLGAVPHEKIRDILVQGKIFLNTSLTEAFCIAIVEAASCG